MKHLIKFSESKGFECDNPECDNIIIGKTKDNKCPVCFETIKKSGRDELVRPQLAGSKSRKINMYGDMNPDQYYQDLYYRGYYCVDDNEI